MIDNDETSKPAAIKNPIFLAVSFTVDATMPPTISSVSMVAIILFFMLYNFKEY